MAQPDQLIDFRLSLGGGVALLNGMTPIHKLGWATGSAYQEGNLPALRGDGVTPLFGKLAHVDGGCTFFQDNRNDFSFPATHGGLGKIRGSQSSMAYCRKACNGDQVLPCAPFTLGSTLSGTITVSGLQAYDACACISTDVTFSLTYDDELKSWTANVTLPVTCGITGPTMRLEFACFRDHLGQTLFRLNVSGCEERSTWLSPFVNNVPGLNVDMTGYPQTTFPLDLAYHVRSFHDPALTFDSVRASANRCCSSDGDFLIRIRDVACVKGIFERFDDLPDGVVKPYGVASFFQSRTFSGPTRLWAVEENWDSGSGKAAMIREHADAASTAMGSWALVAGLEIINPIRIPTGSTNCQLSFHHRIKVLNDKNFGARMDISIDNGVTFNNDIFTAGGVVINDGYNGVITGTGTGQDTKAGWVGPVLSTPFDLSFDTVIDMNAFADDANDIIIYFRFAKQTGCFYDWLIDDINLTCGCPDLSL